MENNEKDFYLYQKLYCLSEHGRVIEAQIRKITIDRLYITFDDKGFFIKKEDLEYKSPKGNIHFKFFKEKQGVLDIIDKQTLSRKIANYFEGYAYSYHNKELPIESLRKIAEIIGLEVKNEASKL